MESSHLDEETLKAEPDKHAAAWAQLRDPTVCGIIVPGGFGVRGVEGKIAAIQHARVNKVPFLGLCLGMQVAVIEYARNVLGLAGANSTEFDAQTEHPAVIFMPEGDPLHMGGTMRLGARSTLIATRIDAPYPSTDGLSAAVDGTAVGGEEGSASAAPRTPLSKIKTAAGTGTAGASAVVDHGRSLASEVYGFQHSTEPIVSISERHRHRYEVTCDAVLMYSCVVIDEVVSYTIRRSCVANIITGFTVPCAISFADVPSYLPIFFLTNTPISHSFTHLGEPRHGVSAGGGGPALHRPGR